MNPSGGSGPRTPRFCEGCGGAIRAGAKFCAYCRHPIEPLQSATQPETPVCPSCGAEATPDDRFCGDCGAAIEKNPTTDRPRRQAPPHASTPRRSSAHRTANWWTALLVSGGAGLLAFLTSGGNPAAGIIGTAFGAAAFVALWMIFWRSEGTGPTLSWMSSRTVTILGVVLLAVIMGTIRLCGRDIARLF